MCKFRAMLFALFTLLVASAVADGADSPAFSPAMLAALEDLSKKSIRPQAVPSLPAHVRTGSATAGVQPLKHSVVDERPTPANRIQLPQQSALHRGRRSTAAKPRIDALLNRVRENRARGPRHGLRRRA